METRVASNAKIERMNESSLKSITPQIHSRVVSQTPGRLRLKVSASQRNAAQMQEMVKELEAHPDISQVRMNHQTGSIVIHHESHKEAIKNVVGTLKDLGIIFGGITRGESDSAAEVAGAFVDLNKKVSQATDGFIDLRFIVPVGLGSLAIRQLLIKGLQLDIVPWYVLAWYSFDSFLKLHYTNKPEQFKNQGQMEQL
jgi:hypothetical protein